MPRFLLINFHLFLDILREESSSVSVYRQLNSHNPKYVLLNHTIVIQPNHCIQFDRAINDNHFLASSSITADNFSSKLIFQS